MLVICYGCLGEEGVVVLVICYGCLEEEGVVGVGDMLRMLERRGGCWC